MIDKDTTMTDLCPTCHEAHEPLPALGFIAPHRAEHPLVHDYTHGISYAEAQARVDAALNGFNTAEAH